MEGIDKIILAKMCRYCAYQERCEQEVRLKLGILGVRGKEADIYVQSLEEDGFIDRLRFIEAYCRGKFRQKKWGRLKIRAGLRAKGFRDAEISNAIEGIDSVQYRLSCKEVLAKKGFNSALSHGYESSLVNELAREIGVEPRVWE